MSAKDYFSQAELAMIWMMPQEPAVAYDDVRMSAVSLLRFGGSLNGHRYVYVPEHDLCIRADVHKAVLAMRKAESKRARDEAKARAKAAQGALL